jgi:transposase
MKVNEKVHKNSRLTEAEKVIIINSYAAGIKPSTIALQLKKSSNAVSTFYSRYKFIKDLPPKEKKSRTKISGRLGQQIKKMVVENPKLGLRKLATKLRLEHPEASWYPSVNIRTPRKSSLGTFLSDNMWKKRNPTLVPPLSRANKAKRFAFTSEWLVDGKDTLGNVIWTDESRVASHPNNRKLKVWTNTGEVPYQVKIHSGGNSVMFWGCFSKHGTGPLVSLQGSMDGPKYIEVLQEHLLPELVLGKRSIPGSWRMMQDNAPCHTSKLVTAFLRKNKVDFIDWPPYSPDLNPIENIWHWMKHVLETEFPVCNSAEEIEERFFKIWKTITPEMCAKYCAHYERRLKAVAKAKGGYTKY